MDDQDRPRVDIMLRIRVGNLIYDLAGDSAAELTIRLRKMGLIQRDESGEVVARSTSASAALKLREALVSREPAALEPEELDSVRAALEHWATEARGGFSAIPADLVALRHGIVDL